MDGVAIKSAHMDGLPVPSTEWGMDAPCATLKQYIDFHLQARSAVGDPDFLGVDMLGSFGSADRIGQVCIYTTPKRSGWHICGAAAAAANADRL